MIGCNVDVTVLGVSDETLTTLVVVNDNVSVTVGGASGGVGAG
jgi:hypothetical protein